MTTSAPEPITLGVVWGALQSICVEIGSTVQRTAYSIQAREGQDFSVAVFDARGRMSAQGPYSPGHLGAMSFAVGNFLSAFPADTLRPGDALLLNDPQLGSGHFPDFLVAQPCFWRGELVGFGVNLVHHTDVGGSRPGSQAVEGVFDWHQEGLRIPPVKIVDAGLENEAALAIIGANSRVPRNVLGDLRSQRASLRVGERRMGELYDRFGRQTVEACVESMLDETEARIRQRIAGMPDGIYAFEDFMDDCGTGTDPLRIAVAVTVSGDCIAVDFDGTDPQTESGLNSYFNYTRSYVYAALKCLTDPYAPMNAGALRPIEITAPEGCFLNPRPPAGGGPRAAICTRVFEVILGALAPAVPEAVTAANSHFCNATFGAWDPVRRRRFVGYELIHGGTGGRAERDGCEAMSSPYNAANIPVEAVEAATPVIVERFELIPDSGGRGRHRGGLGVRRDVRILGESIKLTNLSERHRFRPFGVLGGEPGQLGRTVVNPGTSGERVIGGKASVDLEYGDVVSFQLAGAGGYGDPAERDPRAIEEDLRLGLVTQPPSPLEGGWSGWGGMTPPIRVVVAKPGLDGHDRGAKVVAQALKDAGMEVIYTGRHQTVDQIVSAVVQEDADAVGLSVLSGAHMDYCARLRRRLDEEGAGDVVLLVGGTIPAADVAALEHMGYGVFGTGSHLADIVTYVQEQVDGRRGRSRP